MEKEPKINVLILGDAKDSFISQTVTVLSKLLSKNYATQTV